MWAREGLDSSSPLAVFTSAHLATPVNSAHQGQHSMSLALHLPGLSAGVTVSCVNPYTAETCQGLPSGHQPCNKTGAARLSSETLLEVSGTLSSNAGLLQNQHHADNAEGCCQCEPYQGPPESRMQGLLSKLCWMKTERSPRVLLNVPEEVASLKSKSLGEKNAFLHV